MNGYELSRTWFDWCFVNPDKIKPNHSALYFFCIEHCNRLGWKDKFGLPTTMAMEALGIKSYNTYKQTLVDLVEWGFIKMIETSKNQYSANIVALSNFNKAVDKALDKALIKHASKQSESTNESIDSIDKQLTINNKPLNKEQCTKIEFDLFWNSYDKKVGDKDKIKAKWNSLNIEDQKLILVHVHRYKIAQSDKKYRKDPSTYLNNKSWFDEIIYSKKSSAGGDFVM